ncbi:hypothetical protein CC78DRAFT_572229 [Lojkania enalia]|uniref:Uncharacterized protein n=1 Tax=Lojkania enalia TaxID=147567 RepID=A0A9P4N4Z9_9PLEO|nr:hypothetical protein CC78DRAFT_572229 [Didymosphaeria enalia]
MEENEPFLGANLTSSRNSKARRRLGSSNCFIFFISAFNIIILAANLLILAHRVYFADSHATSTSTCYRHFPNEILGAVARYERKPHLFVKFQDSPYTGSPNEENNKAWHELMQSMVIRVTKEELDHGQQNSLPLPGGGYMAWLGAYHELHCIYSNYYHPNLSSNTAEYAHLSVHADHCIEMLRASALCHADGSLTTFKWSPSSSKPMLDLTRPGHKCIDWSSLMDSLKDRFVGQDEIEKMVNPNFEGEEEMS